MLAHLEVGQGNSQEDLRAQLGLEPGRVLDPHESFLLLLHLLPCRGRLEQILAKPRRVPSVHVAAVVIPLHIPDPGNEG